MAQEPNLKINVGADTSQFERGMRQAKTDLKAFGSVSDDVLGKLGSALGLDTKQIEQMASAIRGMGQKMESAGGEGESAFKKIASAAKGAGASIAAIGIAGAIASFKLLNAEAEAFKNTIAGANIELQTKAYIDTYQQVFHDFNAGSAQSVAEFEANWKKGFAKWKANFGQTVVNTLTGNTSLATALGGPVIGALFGNKDQMQAAETAAKSAEGIAKQIFDIDRQRSDNLVKIAELERTIAENQRIMKSDTASLAEKQAAYAAAEEAVKNKYALQLPLMQERARLLTEMNGLAGSTVEQVDAANRAQAEAINLEGQQEDELRSLERMAKGITSANNANNAALREQLELQKKIAQSRADLAGLNLGVGGLIGPGASTAGGGIIPQTFNTTALQEQLNSALGSKLFLQVGIQIEKGSLVDLSNQVNSVVTNLAGSLSSAIGGLVGDLLTGGDAWGNFANAALSAFGDMATAVGKIAIECGIAALGIKAALESLGPAGAAMAIAAGAALVALGAAVKAGLSNVAGGNYSAASGVASGAYGSAGSDYQTRNMTVQVSGTLQADGDQLVAVLNNTSNKKGYTT